MARLINIGTGVVVNVADEKVARLGSEWSTDGKALRVDSSRSASPDKSWKVADLKAHAEENGIDLLDATKKDDILAAISLAGEESADDESGASPDDES